MDIQRDDLKKAKRRRQWGIGTGIGALLTAVVVAVLSIPPAVPRVDRASVWLDIVKRGEMRREVRGPGVPVPREIRWITAETSAQVQRILVKPGAVVEPDTVLLELSNPEVLEQLAGAVSAVAAARADHLARRMWLDDRRLDQKANFAQVEAD